MECMSLFILTIANRQRQTFWQHTQILQSASTRNQGVKWREFVVDIVKEGKVLHRDINLKVLYENNHDIYAEHNVRLEEH